MLLINYTLIGFRIHIHYSTIAVTITIVCVSFYVRVCVVFSYNALHRVLFIVQQLCDVITHARLKIPLFYAQYLCISIYSAIYINQRTISNNNNTNITMWQWVAAVKSAPLQITLLVCLSQRCHKNEKQLIQMCKNGSRTKEEKKNQMKTLRMRIMIKTKANENGLRSRQNKSQTKKKRRNITMNMSWMSLVYSHTNSVCKIFHRIRVVGQSGWHKWCSLFSLKKLPLRKKH